MDFVVTIFNELLFRPTFNLLVWTYNIIPGHDFGIAIIIVTILLRILLYPLSEKALKSQKRLQELQPQIQEIQKRYKNKEEKARAVMGFYKENNISPVSGCVPILIQLPILIALYRVFLVGLEPDSLNHLYSFVHNPKELNPLFWGLVDLSQPNHILAMLAGASQFLQVKTARISNSLTPGAVNDFAKSMNQSMIYLMPLFMVFIAWKLPAGLALYWVVTMVFSTIQQIMIYKK